jgi:hypothetical protein
LKEGKIEKGITLNGTGQDIYLWFQLEDLQIRQK